MLVKVEGESGYATLMGSYGNLFATRNLGSIEEVLCPKSCSDCGFFSRNPGCKMQEQLLEQLKAREEIQTILATFGQFYE